jgi:hypothetical protein
MSCQAKQMQGEAVLNRVNVLKYLVLWPLRIRHGSLMNLPQVVISVWT